MKIYTKTGDKGTTSLFGGKRVSKKDIQIEAYGTVDELNAFIGLLIAQIEDKAVQNTLKTTQSTLFDIGSHLASDGTADKFLPEIPIESYTMLEKEMDRYEQELPALKSFILPGGNETISLAHICRTICRRAERRVVSLADEMTVNTAIVIYLNRLSDYFFVLARKIAAMDGIDEVKWNPK